jgi:hypothetical protein
VHGKVILHVRIYIYIYMQGIMLKVLSLCYGPNIVPFNVVTTVCSDRQIQSRSFSIITFESLHISSDTARTPQTTHSVSVVVL